MLENNNDTNNSNNKAYRIVDLCCGVGFSTRALREAFSSRCTVIGIDTSPEMVRTIFYFNVIAFYLSCYPIS